MVAGRLTVPSLGELLGPAPSGVQAADAAEDFPHGSPRQTDPLGGNPVRAVAIASNAVGRADAASSVFVVP